MKTQINQLITIVGFFTLSIVTTLAISWGMSHVIYDEVVEQEPLHEIIMIKAHSKVNIDLSKPLRMLLPKSSPSSNR